MKLPALLLFGSLLATPLVEAVTFDFEDIGGDNNYHDITNPYHGYDFNFTLDVVDITNPDSPWGATGPAHSGQNAVLNNNGGVGQITQTDLGTFIFTELWIRGWYTWNDAVGAVAGYNGASLEFTIPINVNQSWQLVSGNSTPITRLDISLNNGQNIFLIDDLILNGQANVPEAGTAVALLGLSLAAIGLTRRQIG